MPTLRKRILSCQKHRANGQAVVSFSGRDFYLGQLRTKASKLENDHLVNEWLKQVRQIQPDTKADGISVVEMLAAYLHFARAYYPAMQPLY